MPTAAYSLSWKVILGALDTGAARKKQLMIKGSVIILLLFSAFVYMSWTSLSSTYLTTETNTSVGDSTLPTNSHPRPNTSSPPPPSSSYDSRKVALLVESRPLPHLPALFTHMTNLVPPEWTFRFMGSPISIDFMRASPLIKRLEASRKLTIIPIPSNYSVSDRESISQMFTDPHLYGDILAPAEHLLVFQPDSIFCANAPKTVNDFLEWDWIGAPWSPTSEFGGNGGLSLRKVSKILDVLGKERRPNDDPELEDLWLCNRLNQLEGVRLPNATLSKTFSVEGVWDESPLGYHVGWLGVHHGQLWDDQAQVDHIMQYCPEIKMILGMKLEGDKPDGIPR